MSKISVKYQKDYKNSDYSNPRIERQKEQRKNKIKKIIIGLISSLVGLSVYVFLFSPLFQIKKTDKQFIDRLVFEEITRKSAKVFSHSNLLHLDTVFLERMISQKYLFDSVVVKKDYPSTLIIEIKEKEGVLAWQTKENCFLVDLKGEAFAHCGDEITFLLVKDLQKGGFVLGEKITTENELNFCLELKEKLSQLFKEEQFNFFEKENKEIKTKMINGPELLLNIDFSIEDQINKLAVLFNNSEIKNKWGSLQYIDLRFGDKIFYK